MNALAATLRKVARVRDADRRYLLIIAGLTGDVTAKKVQDKYNDQFRRKLSIDAIAMRLKKLMGLKLIQRVGSTEPPIKTGRPFYCYALTKAGKDVIAYYEQA